MCARQLIYRDFAALWQLHHRNIAVFIGLYSQDEEQGSPPAMVVRREKHFSVLAYLRENPNPHVVMRIVSLCYPFPIFPLLPAC